MHPLASRRRSESRLLWMRGGKHANMHRGNRYRQSLGESLSRDRCG